MLHATTLTTSSIISPASRLACSRLETPRTPQRIIICSRKERSEYTADQFHPWKLRFPLRCVQNASLIGHRKKLETKRNRCIIWLSSPRNSYMHPHYCIMSFFSFCKILGATTMFLKDVSGSLFELWLILHSSSVPATLQKRRCKACKTPNVIVRCSQQNNHQKSREKSCTYFLNSILNS